MHLYDLDPKPVRLALFYLMNVRDVHLKPPPPPTQPRSQGSLLIGEETLIWSGHVC